MSLRGLRGSESARAAAFCIDEACATSDADIYAIGECALWNERIYGLVAPGYQMAKVVAGQLCGDKALPFVGADMSTS